MLSDVFLVCLLLSFSQASSWFQAEFSGETRDAVTRKAEVILNAERRKPGYSGDLEDGKADDIFDLEKGKADGIRERRKAAISEQQILNVSRQLWAADSGKMKNGSDFLADLHGPRLFTYMNTSLLKSRPTYRAMRPLLTTYNPELGVAENVTDVMTRREDAFLAAILDSDVMRRLHTFLKSVDLASPTRKGFVAQLRYWWFEKYSRTYGGTINDTSAWEHVFVGEYRHRPKRTFKGLHNWVQMYWEEAAVPSNITNLSFMASCSNVVQRMKFFWQDRSKSHGSSFFLGSSPEYNMAVFTLCFRTRPGGPCTVTTDGRHNVTIQTMIVGPKTNRMVSTAFPLCRIKK